MLSHVIPMIYPRKTTVRARQGFTLVELLVAMALTIFVMVILTQAFVVSIDLFSGLKGIGDMQDNMRAGGNVLRYDLSQNHFEGRRRPSDAVNGTATFSIAGQQPREGFLAFNAAGAGLTAEGQDGDSLTSKRATNQVLQFTSRLKGNQQQSFYSTQVGDKAFFNLQTFYNMDPAAGPFDADATLRIPAGGPFYRSQWAEIAYFLLPTGTTEEALNPPPPNGTGSATTTTLYGLYRAQFVPVTDNTAANAKYKGSPKSISNFPGMACRVPAPGADLVFYSPADLANATTRTFDPTNPSRSAALVVPNVVSFQVQAVISSGSALDDTTSYDSAGSVPAQPLTGIYIILRVWDHKTRQTRQMSIMQDL
jgi:prepilin-type N-terminal cleavage/methylation domain-containing protein